VIAALVLICQAIGATSAGASSATEKELETRRYRNRVIAKASGAG
jgi:hypothetical protein